MDLKSILPGLEEKKESIEHFWSLVIEPGWVQTGIWKVTDGKAEIIASSLPAAWELEDELVKAADSSLSSSIQHLSDDVSDPKKAVFGVVASWVKDGEISSDHLEKIKKICSDLSLEPAGFVVLPEAISHLVKSEEGSPLTGIVIGVFREEIELSIFMMGNLIGTVSVARSVSILDDCIEGVNRFDSLQNNLPSRIILYDGKEGDLEDVRQELLKAEWDLPDNLKFLHTPKIELISDTEKIAAISLAGASEIANVSGLLNTPKDEEIVEESNLQSSDQMSAKEIGFVLGEDVSRIEMKNSPRDFDSSEELDRSMTVEQVEKENQISEEELEIVPVSKPEKKKFHLNISLPPILSKFPKFNFPARHTEKGSSSQGKKLFTTGLIIFLLLAGTAFSAYYFLPKAEITIFVGSKKLEDKFDVSIDPNRSDMDSEGRIIPGTSVSDVFEGERTKSTTGTKTVGERAIGEITLYRVGTEISLDKGSVIEGPNNLEFTLNDDISIASGSASSVGETVAKVTAKDIGAEYNFAANTTFTVEGFSKSDIEGKNKDSFSGGSSRQISAVSTEDRDVLKESLLDELVDRAKTSFAEKAGSDKIFAEGSIKYVEDTTDFSAKVGDEAATLKLSLKLTVTGVYVDKTSLNDFAQKVLNGNVPQGFVLRNDQIKSEFDYVDETDGIYKFNLRLIANLLPSLDPIKIAKDISGRTPDTAKKYFMSEVPGFSRAEILFKPKLPGKLSTLPHVSKNIDVQITAER